MATIYLTVDDAPSERLPAKVSLIQEHDVPAVFFCEGRKLADYPDHARTAAAAGYHLGNHAYSHTTASELSVERFRDEVERTEDLLDEIYADGGIERPARLFRFPYGDAGGDNADEFQAVLTDFDFVPPALDGEATGTSPLDASAMGDGWRAGDRDWAWTLHVEDWELESVAELRERLAAVEERLASDGAELFLFHDQGTDLALFETLIEECRQYGASFGDPLALVPDGE
mgnify:CR=1 FL=1